MARATMTLLGLLHYNPHLLDGLSVPNGMSLEHTTNLIKLECGNLEVQYPNPGYMESMVSVWSATRQHIWQRLYDTTQYKYDPIYNYDRKEEREFVENRQNNENYTNGVKRTGSETDVDGRTVTDKLSGSTNTTDTGTKTDAETLKRDVTETTTENKESSSVSDTIDTKAGTTTEKVSAFNSATYEPSKETDYDDTLTSDAHGKTTTDATVSKTTDEDTTRTVTGDHTSRIDAITNNQHNITESANSDKSTTMDEDGHGEKDETGKLTHKETLRAYGNIGVTTTQQMIEAEREVAQFDIYQYIVSDFRNFFCILVY